MSILVGALLFLHSAEQLPHEGSIWLGTAARSRGPLQEAQYSTPVPAASAHWLGIYLHVLIERSAVNGLAVRGWDGKQPPSSWPVCLPSCLSVGLLSCLPSYSPFPLPLFSMFCDVANTIRTEENCRHVVILPVAGHGCVPIFMK